MSLKTFLSHLWDAISSIFEKAAKEVRDIALPVVINVLNAAKALTDADTEDLIGKLAGTAGADVEDKIRTALPKILIELKLVDAALQTETPDQIIAAAFANLRLSSDDAKNAFYHSIAALLLQDLSDGQVSWSEAVELVEFYYKNNPDNTATATTQDDGPGDIPPVQGPGGTITP
jgi:hypothetical protein